MELVHYRVGDEYVVGIGTFTKHAALFFYRGSELPDPQRLLQGSGKQTRFLSLRSVADPQSPAARGLLHDAFRLAAGDRATARG